MLGRLRDGATAVAAGLRRRITATLMEDGVVATLAPLAWTLVLLVLYQGDGLNNLFIYMTGPWCSIGHSSNSIIGYSNFLHNGNVFHNENFALAQSEIMLAGGEVDPSFYALRPGSALLAFLLFPWLPALMAAKALNWVGALAAVWAARSIGTDLGLRGVSRSLFAILSVSVSAIVFHTSDLSAHLSGVALWLVSLALILRIKPWERGTGWSGIFFLIALLTFSLSVYAANAALFVGFVVSLVRRPIPLAVSTLAFLGAMKLRTGWAAFINFVYERQIDYEVTEKQYLDVAIGRWKDSISGDDIFLPRYIWHYINQFLSSEPITVICLCLSIILLCFVAVSGRNQLRSIVADPRLLLMGAAFGATLVSGLVWAPAAGARGYISYGLPLSAMGMVVLLLAGRKSAVITATLGCLLVWQIVWVTAVRFDNPVPVCAHFLGNLTDDHPLSVFQATLNGFSDPLHFLVMGEDRAGGIALVERMTREGLAEIQGQLPAFHMFSLSSRRSAWKSLALSAFLLAPLVVVGAVWMRGGVLKRSLVPVVVLLLVWGQAWAFSRLGKKHPEIISRLNVECREEVETISYRITLNGGEVADLEEFGTQRLHFLTGSLKSNAQNIRTATLRLDNFQDKHLLTLTASPRGIYGDFVQLQNLLADAAPPYRLVLEERYDRPLQSFIAWGAAGPDASSGTCGRPQVPFLEIRALRQNEIVPKRFLFTGPGLGS